MILTSCGTWLTDCRDRPPAIDRHIDYFGEPRVPTSPRPIVSAPARTEGEPRTLMGARAEEHTASMRRGLTTGADPVRGDYVLSRLAHLCDEAEAIG